METKEIPILLLTGYLGSGKTTLLNYLLSNREGIKFAVIVNDIGEINIDAELIQKGGIVGQKSVWWLCRTAVSAVPSVPTLSNRYLS